MAPKKPNLTKSPKPNPDADLRLPKAGKHSKTETGILSREFGASRILEFCAFAEKNAVSLFAEKNAVSLANQDCKGALASKKPCLSKNREPKPEFSLR